MFEQLLNETISQIDVIDNQQIFFTLSNGNRYVMMHHQDCCEDVYLDEVHGDFDDLLDNPILLAEKITDYNETEWGDSLWTFYKLATVKGHVTLKWYGSSNGYYSIGVSFKIAD